MKRVTGIERSRRVTITIDGAAMQAFEGEMLLAAMRAGGLRAGGWCNMGSCAECMVMLADKRRVRACLVPVHDGLVASTDG